MGVFAEVEGADWRDGAEEEVAESVTTCQGIVVCHGTLNDTVAALRISARM